MIEALTWTLSGALILFSIETVWLEPLVKSHVHRRLPSLIADTGSTIWTVEFGAIGISCGLLTVCLVFLLKTESLKSFRTFGTATTVVAAIVLSVIWFRVVGMGPTNPHSVTLQWQASTSVNIQGYNVYRKALPSGSEKKLNGYYLVRGLTFTDVEVDSGVRYRYTVRAFNGSESIDCTPVEVVVP